MFKYECCGEEESFVEKIGKVKARLSNARAAVEDAKYVEQLIFSDYIRTIKSHKTTWDYRVPTIKAAREEIGKTKKKERANLSYVESSIKEDFFKEFDFDIKIHEIMQGGYEGYYWNLTFNIKDAEYTIQIPSRSELTVDNVKYAHEGRFVFLKRTSACCTTVLFEDWTEEGLAIKIKEYFKNENTTSTVEM